MDTVPKHFLMFMSTLLKPISCHYHEYRSSCSNICVHSIASWERNKKRLNFGGHENHSITKHILYIRRKITALALTRHILTPTDKWHQFLNFNLRNLQNVTVPQIGYAMQVLNWFESNFCGSHDHVSSTRSELCSLFLKSTTKVMKC